LTHTVCNVIVLLDASLNDKNTNLSFRKQLENDSKATHAGQTWSDLEKRPN